MAGHSKWHNIRLRKGKQDAERGKLFTRLAREIIVAAREGGGNPDANPRLRLAIQRAREAHMPQENIKRAIQRGTGEIAGAAYEEVTYEGYAPGGVAVMVECLTDNRNRTVSDVRAAFSKCGGSLGESGCVSWMFKPRGLIRILKQAGDEDTVLAAALDAGADDMNSEEEFYEVYTEPEDLHRVREVLEGAGLPVDSAEITMLPTSTVHVEGKEAQQVLRLMNMLDDIDDVQQVYANFDIAEEEIESAVR
jgi:YebC/PmpR family DNA-binding regulatory protein